MAPLFTGGKLVIASHNQGKVREIGDLLAPLGAEIMSIGAFGGEAPEETGDSFDANARLKAVAAAALSGLPALADDSGLVVPALGGAPGIHSARWAGPGGDFDVAMERVTRELDDKDDWRAHFICVLCLARPDGAIASFEGRVHGTIVWPRRGTAGFGYDPIFRPEGYDVTFGEMEPAAKHAISHRAEAFRKLVASCFPV